MKLANAETVVENRWARRSWVGRVFRVTGSAKFRQVETSPRIGTVSAVFPG